MRHDSRGASSLDTVFLFYISVLVLFGFAMLTSASTPVGLSEFGDKYFFVKRQLFVGLIPGIIACYLFSKLPYTVLRRSAPWAYGASLLLLLLVFIPGVGNAFGTGANSWLVIAGFSLQPAELAKFGMILFMSAYLVSHADRINDMKHGFWYALALGMAPIVLVMLQPDLGTVAILSAILLGLFFVAGIRWHFIVLLVSAGIIAFLLLIFAAPYRTNRFMTFLHPELDPQGIGYHINQAFLAIGSGGWLGLGLGHSRQKFQYLPEVHADSIFAVIAEEMGFVVSLGLVFLYALISFRGFVIAKHAPDPFARLLVSGIVVWFASQAFLNIGAMLGIFPLTGVPLPFVSHGGSALFISLAAVGIVLNISKHTRLGV